MMAKPITIADLATLLARGYIRLDSQRIFTQDGHQGHKSAESGQIGLDVPGEQSDESSVVNARRSP